MGTQSSKLAEFKVVRTRSKKYLEVVISYNSERSHFPFTCSGPVTVDIRGIMPYMGC